MPEYRVDESILVSKEEYKDMVKAGKLKRNVIDPNLSGWYLSRSIPFKSLTSQFMHLSWSSVETIRLYSSLRTSYTTFIRVSPKLSSPFDHPHPFLQRSTPMSFQVLVFVPNCNCRDWVVSAFICFLSFASFSACFFSRSCSSASCCNFLLRFLWLLTSSSSFLYSS